MLLDLGIKTGFRLGRLLGAAWRRIGLRVATTIHRATLASVGSGSRFQRGVRFAQPDAIHIGRNCYFWRGCNASADYPGHSLHIGDSVQINADVHLDTTGGLTIGDRVLISESAVIYTHDHGLDPHSMPVGMRKCIAEDVWVGMRAVILPKCQNIGAGAVIGACAVVTNDVPAGAIMAGNPARVVGFRDVVKRIAA